MLLAVKRKTPVPDKQRAARQQLTALKEFYRIQMQYLEQLMQNER